MKFVKMHGCGNDYIYINLFQEEETIPDKSELARTLSNRHFGIGSDGVIFISPSSIADFKIEIYNADGSFAEMCGNGIRCAAKFVYDQNILSVKKPALSIESAGSIKYVHLIFQNGKVIAARVNMGKPELTSSKIPVITSKPKFIRETISVAKNPNDFYEVTCVSMGNPHCVIFTNDLSQIDLEHVGPLLEHHNLFPKRTNVEFVQVIRPSLLKMRVWERGAGETLACGTGCCAAVVAGVLNHLTERKVIVQVPGGELYITWDHTNGNVYMTGAAETIFEGKI